MLLVLDSEFTPGQRMWSLFELALVVERRDTKTPILLDVGTATYLPANMYFPNIILYCIMGILYYRLEAIAIRSS